MSETLAARLGLGRHELVAFVGAGGKSTLLFALGDELAGAGCRVILTTTTKLGAEQAARAATVCRSTDPAQVAGALDGPGPVMVVAGRACGKIRGPSSEAVERLFAEAGADHLLVEADGSRRRPFKAPASHEPVIPRAASLVVVVMGADAIGGVISDVCHRPELVAAIAGRTVGDVLDPETCAAVLVDPQGGYRGVPSGARVAIAITKVTPERAGPVGEILRMVEATGLFAHSIALAPGLEAG